MSASDCLFYTLDAWFVSFSLAANNFNNSIEIGLFLRVGRWPWREKLMLSKADILGLNTFFYNVNLSLSSSSSKYRLHSMLYHVPSFALAS